MKKILWLAVFSFILVVIMGCNLFTSLLSPARKITGTWKSTFPITLYYATDECLNVDTITRVGEQKFNITWIIKQSYNLEPNTVDITVYMEEAGDWNYYGSCELFTGAFWDSEEYYTGVISSTSLTLYDLYGDKAGDFTFTTDLMQGTLKDIYYNFYSFGWESDVNAYKLIKQ
ncbi:MAG: hypothetical protein DRP87_06540 [Spirochaetes bacterium]|nr:MAG: hypothetical protein DRP87_06540 [Spirochaetota bacterium]